MIPGIDMANALLTLIGGLLVIVWWSIRSWMCKVDAKLDQVITKQAQQDKDCVTWADMEKERLRLNEHDRRLTVVETSCEARHNGERRGQAS